MTGHSVAFSVSLVRLGKRGEVEVHKVRREEGFVRPRKGQDEANFASDESLSIITGIDEGKSRAGDVGMRCYKFISVKRYWIVRNRN
jgi:hypothetical protein